MTDLQFRYLMNLYGGNQGSRFTPGGGTFPRGGGAGSNFSNVGQPFGQTGPGFTDDLGHPMHPLPGNFPTEMTDRGLIHPFDNTLALDAGMVQNPDFPFSGGFGDDKRVYDPGEMQALIDSLRSSSPGSLPNPPPNEAMNPYDAYGAPRPGVPTYPPSDMVFPPGLADPNDLFNPNTAPTDPGMETIAFQGQGAGGEWPPLPPDLNFAAPDVPQQYPTPSEFQQGVPLTGSNPSGFETMPFDIFSEVYGQPPGNVGADQLGNVPSELPGSVTADQLGNPPSDLGSPPGSDFQWPFYVDQFPSGNTPAAPDDTSGPGFTGGAGGTPPTGYYGPSGPNVVGSPNPGLFPNAPGIVNATPSPGIPDAQGNIIPGTMVSASDAANAYNMEQFPGSGGVGQFFTDTAGNIIDATGKLIMTAATAAGQIPGQLSNMLSGIANNIMNDPGWSSPDYLRSMGYAEGQGTGSLWPGTPSNSGFGVGGEGGSFFGGTMNFNPGGGDLSSQGGQVISSSVGPPQGGGGPPMWGPMDLSGFLNRSAGFTRPYSPFEWTGMNATEKWRGGFGGTIGNYRNYLGAWHSPTGMSGLQYAMSGRQPKLFGGIPSSWFTGITPFTNLQTPLRDAGPGGTGIQRGDVGASPQMMHATSGKYSPK